MSGRRPQNCRSCGKLMGIADECPYCGARRNSPIGYIKGFIRGSGRSGGWTVTQSLMYFCGFIFILGLLITLSFAGVQGMLSSIFRPSGVVLQILGANSAQVFSGVWWTPITSLFLHVGVIHLAFNLYALYVIGNLMEDTFGRSTYWLIFLISGAFGASLSAFMGYSAAGASGGVLGLIGSGIVAMFLSGRSADDPVLRTLLMWTAFIFLFGLISGTRIDHWGHFGGFVAGSALASLWFHFHRNLLYRKVVGVLAWVGLALVPVAYTMHILWLFT